MEERAEAARSRWRVVAAVATALLVVKSLADRRFCQCSSIKTERIWGL